MDIHDWRDEDLLGRQRIEPDPHLMRTAVEGRTVLVTGAAGSIGAELCRTIARLNPAKLVLLDFHECGLFEIRREIVRGARFPLVAVLGSVLDQDMMRHLLTEHHVDAVYHCAAYKHVGMVEDNCVEGVRNNVLGTAALCEAAHDCGVAAFILVSSDKAVRPASVMGATKCWAEQIVRHHASRDDRSPPRRFASVRFGNVLASSGSVVPLFRAQIAAGGPVTLTHEEMTRCFMTAGEAAELILQAGALAGAGDTLLLDLGQPIRIRDLARDLIARSGYRVGRVRQGIEIVTVGPGAGEKLHEEWADDPSDVVATAHPKIMRDRGATAAPTDLPARLDVLRHMVAARDEGELRKMLFAFAEG